MMNPILESYLVGLVSGVGLGGLVAIPLFLHRVLASTLRDSVSNDE